MTFKNFNSFCLDDLNKSLDGLVNYSSDFTSAKPEAQLVAECELEPTAEPKVQPVAEFEPETTEDEEIVLEETVYLRGVSKSNKNKPKYILKKGSAIYNMVLTTQSVQKSKKQKGLFSIRLRCNKRKSKTVEFDCPGSAIAFFKDINMVEYKNGDSTKLILSNSSDIIYV